MKRLTLATVGVAGLLAVGVLPMAGVANAATESNVSIRPIGPRVAEVCWTAYNPDTGSVDSYSIASDPGGSVPTYAGTGSNVACALFDDLNNSRTYTFTVTANMNGGGTEVAGTMVAQGVAMTAAAKPRVITVGKRATLRGTVRAGWGTGLPLSGVKVTLQAKRVDSTTWRRLPGTVTTDAKGVWTRKVKPAVNFKYRALSLSPTIAGKDSFGGWSSQVDVGVKPAISLRFSKNPVYVGNTVRFSGKVVAGNLKLMAGDPISLERREGTRWRILRSATVRANGTYGIKLLITGPKDYKYRWEYRGGREYSTAHSPTKLLRVL